MKKDIKYYISKVAVQYFNDLPEEEKEEAYYQYLSKDEREHLNQLGGMYNPHEVK